MSTKFLKKLFVFLLLAVASLQAQKIKILESNDRFIELELDFKGTLAISDTLIEGTKFKFIKSDLLSLRKTGEPWLPQAFRSIGIPIGSKPSVSYSVNETRVMQNVMIMPYPDNKGYFEKYDKNNFDPLVYGTDKLFPSRAAELGEKGTVRFSTSVPLLVSPIQYNPVQRELVINNKLRVRVDYNLDPLNNAGFVKVNDPLTEEMIRSSVINPEQAMNWIGKQLKTNMAPAASNWYNPNRNYFKLYYAQTGVYRVTFEELIAAGVPIGSGVNPANLEVIMNGVSVPLDISTGQDTIFNSGDYFKLVAYKLPPSLYNRQNIFNTTNLMWFSFEGNGDSPRYRKQNGIPNGISDNTLFGHLRTDFYEKDSLYERLGYADDADRDHWYWDKATGYRGTSTYKFRGQFKEFKNFDLGFSNVTMRVSMHGMTETSCSYGHHAKIKFNDRLLGEAWWSGQKEYIFERNFYISADSFPMFPAGNYLTVELDGRVCHPDSSDEIRVNWFEFTYFSMNRVSSDNFYLTNPSAVLGYNFYRLWQWKTSDAIVYVPGKQLLIDTMTITNDNDSTIAFADTALSALDYFCVDPNYFMTVDSIRKDQSSDLKNIQTGADLIVITHSKFNSVAERYKNFRTNNWTDKTIANPRIKIVDVQDIYDEFSNGLLDPLAIRDYLKYAFENYSAPAASYVCLVGDMSYDYRMIQVGSRPNYIPSMSHHSYTYGEAASDNGFVCVVGNDILPEMTIGRISIETVEEGNILLDKLENYPADAGKKWRETVLMLASGLNNDDEIRFGFNDASMQLVNSYVTPQGFDPKLIFRYPNRPEHFQYRGTSADIRESINTGAAIVNYYGHGGGYQWDLTFLNEDIYVLENQGRLPLILSVTCYTAHFDNQNVFGEQFNKVPGKGSIGFFGSSGLTHWEIGKFINQLIFDNIFVQKEYVAGKAVLNAKRATPPIGFYGNQIALLTYLGDPLFKLALPDKPDFVLKNSDISLSQTNPVIGDSIDITIRFSNFGITINDSVSVRLSFSNADTAAIIETRKMKVFPNRDSLLFNWRPSVGGLIQLKAEINLTDSIDEMDYADNTATYSLPVFNISEPSTIKPLDGEMFVISQPEFIIADFGTYTSKTLEYYIQIDTNLTFTQPVFVSNGITSADGVIRFLPPPLSAGSYFWRARIFDGENYGKWTSIKTFTIGTEAKTGYHITGKQLLMFERENLNFSGLNQSLALNTSLLPPKPSRERMISDVGLDSTIFANFGLSAMATDGKYLYLGNHFYWMSLYYQDSTGKSKIYKIGTGQEGTVAGQFYGEIPNFRERIGNQYCYFRTGHLYVPTVNPYKVLRVDVSTGAKDTVNVPEGFIDAESGKVKTGNFNISSDSNYIYCLAIRDSVNSLGLYKYTLNVYDPMNGMQRVASHYYPTVNSYSGFVYYFVSDGYFYPYENFLSGFMRRIRISDGFYDQEWIPGYDENPNKITRYYAWAIDQKNNLVYGSIYRPGVYVKPAVTKFAARYIDATGIAITPAIGPAHRWKKSAYELGNVTGQTIASLVMLGYNKTTRLWDTLKTQLPDTFDMSGIDNSLYPQVKVSVQFIDSSFNSANPIEFRKLSVDYDNLPELVLKKGDISFSPDSLLQGLPITMSCTLRNLQSSDADSVTVDFYIDQGDSAFYSKIINVKRDSLSTFTHTFNTAPYIFQHPVKAIVSYPRSEMYTFNNILSREFFVARDSINPVFRITFDDKEIINGDIVSKRPEIKISLKDNSPLPLDTTFFTLLFDNVPLSFSREDLTHQYTQYPNSEMMLTWNPTLTKGRHTLDVLAKDASGNFFDTTFYRSIFFVYDQDDIVDIYNYPNPFKGDTYFTFELRGSNMPDEISIRIFTIAGRLIREIRPARSELTLNFNRIKWDGRDEDGSDIANGVYLYKLTTKYKDKTKSTINKLVKMR